MGTTSKAYFEATHKEFSMENLLDFLDEEIAVSNYKIILASFDKARSLDEHHVVYCLIKHPEGHYYGEVILIDIINNEIYWKVMSCSEGPNYYNCPKEILSMITVSDGYTNNWIKECEKRNISITIKPYIQTTQNMLSFSKTRGQKPQFMRLN